MGKTKVKKMNERKQLFFNSIEECDAKFPRDSDCKKWNDAGRPELWIKVETSINVKTAKKYEVYYDFGFGGLMLKCNNEVIVKGRDSLTGIPGHDIVVLDKNYFGTNKYIWF